MTPSPYPPSFRPKRFRVCRHHAHMCFNMWAWCWYTRGRFERTHGGFSNVSHLTHRTHTTTRDTTTTTATTTQNNTRRQSQRQTEEEDRERSLWWWWWAKSGKTLVEASRDTNAQIVRYTFFMGAKDKSNKLTAGSLQRFPRITGA